MVQNILEPVSQFITSVLWVIIVALAIIVWFFVKRFFVEVKDRLTGMDDSLKGISKILLDFNGDLSGIKKDVSHVVDETKRLDKEIGETNKRITRFEENVKTDLSTIRERI